MAGCENVTIAVTDCARHGSCEVSGQFWRHFDRRREDLWDSAVAGTVNRIDCGECGRRFDPPDAFLYTDTDRGLGKIVSADPTDGQMGLNDFSEMLLAIEAGLTNAALVETKALIAAASGATVDPSKLKLVGIDETLIFADGNDKTVKEDAATGGKVMAQQTKARQTLATRRARRRRHIGDADQAAATFLSVFSSGSFTKSIDKEFDDDIEAVKLAVAAKAFTRDQAYAMARLARRPEVHRFDRARSFTLFEDITGIALSHELETSKARTGLPILAALWYAYAQLPDKARKWGGIGLEEVRAVEGTEVGGAFDTGLSAADPDRILLNFGAIKSPLFARVLRHELAHALHDNNLTVIDTWLTEHFGWKVFQLPVDASTNDSMLVKAVDGWIAELGGWDKAVPAATNDDEKHLVRRHIWAACQPELEVRKGKTMSRWLDDLAGDPGWFPPSLPEQVYIRSPDDWWKAAEFGFPLPDNPQRVAFMCHQYRQLVVVDARACALVREGAIPHDYALMSQKEFFAELYAYWHWRRNGKKSPRKKLRESVPEFKELLSRL